jgi:hypothetical protein
LADGIAIRLYSRKIMMRGGRFTAKFYASLAAVVCASAPEHQVLIFRLSEPPSSRMIEETAIVEPFELGAVDGNQSAERHSRLRWRNFQLTRRWREYHWSPPPKETLTEGADYCAAALSVQDPESSRDWRGRESQLALRNLQIRSQIFIVRKMWAFYEEALKHKINQNLIKC